MPRAVIDGAHCLATQADAARCAADQFDHAFARQGLEVLFSGIGRFETQLGGNFGARGRGPSAGNSRLDQIQNLLLAGRELGDIKHGGLLRGLKKWEWTVF